MKPFVSLKNDGLYLLTAVGLEFIPYIAFLGKKQQQKQPEFVQYI